ncbi:MFS transporter [Desertibacillus haloalkaliphilus]|uniref:MFS transporter n=1 Tax=Desertibacillus haloalkaliphilus TaxID=1328930 RepID=UPI001C25FD12|nr:MFS transporter [Desertibacillus haloalkaliphilus]MBU8906779.1 MFS transporter [Desertibacillus haloalkaliphilus]
MIELQTKQFWRATIALGIASFVIFANVYYAQPLLPVFTDEFALSPAVSSLSVSLVLFSLGVSFFFYSALSDAIGRKKIIVIAMIISSVVTVSIAFVPNFEMLLVLRVLQGVALAGIPTVAMAYIGEEFAARALTLAIGIHISANSIGGMSGRMVSGMVTDWYDWRIAFLVMGVLSLVALVAFMLLLPSSKHFKRKSFDWKSAVTEYKLHLKNRTLRLAYLVGGLHFFIFVGIYNFITYLLSGDPFYVSTTILGFLFITYLAGTFSSTLAGKVSQKLLQSHCIGIGILIMVVSTLLTLVSNLWVIVLGLLGLSFGFFFAHSCSSAWVSKYAQFGKASASGLYLTSYYFGGSLGSFYLSIFWNIGHWAGVVIGAILILAITSYLMLQMIKVEKHAVEVEKGSGTVLAR